MYRQNEHSPAKQIVTVIKHQLKNRRLLKLVTVVVVVAFVGYLIIRQSQAAVFSASFEAESGTEQGSAAAEPQANASQGQAVRFGIPPVSTETPTFTISDVVGGISKLWDIAFWPNGDIFISQKSGALSVFRGGRLQVVHNVSGALDSGEGGLMGVAIDPQFTTNRNVYACFQTDSDIKVARWQMSTAYDSLTNRVDIISGIPMWRGDGKAGWHAGCRMAFGPDGNLWIGTGDAHTAGVSQSLTNLGGKVLRVNRDGQGVSGNLGGGADPRIFNYGHRNIQGIAFFPTAKNGVLGVTAEHGPDTDDEVNELRVGNFGWNSDGSDGGSMTDKSRYPSAISALWSSGSPTSALSGMTVISGTKWKGWNGAVAVATLKTQHVEILRLDAQNKVTKREVILDGQYGRLRQIQQGPDGNLYIAKDIDGKIIKLTPN